TVMPHVKMPAKGLTMPHVRMPAKLGWSGGLDSDSVVNVGQGSGDGGEVDLLGVLLGEAGQDGLEVGDLAGELGGIEAVAVGGQLGILSWGQDPGGQEPVERRRGFVVDPATSTILGGGVVDGFDGGGEVVEPVVG